MKYSVSISSLCEKAFADDGVNFLCRYWNAVAETVDNLCEQTLVDVCAIDDIVELQLGNGNGPYLSSESGNGLCHSLKVEDINLLLGNGFAHLVNHEDNSQVWVLVKIAGQVFLKFIGVIVLYALFGGITHLVVGAFRTKAVEHGVFKCVIHKVHVLSPCCPWLVELLLYFVAEGFVTPAHYEIKLYEAYPVIV